MPAALASAIDAARRQVGEDPKAGLPELAHLYHANRYYGEAQEIYAGLLNDAVAAKDSAKWCYQLADLMSRQGEADDARAWLERSVQHHANYAPSLAALGHARFRADNQVGAENAYRAALRIDPQRSDARVGLARVLVQRNDESEAVAVLEDLVKRDPEDVEGRAMLAPILERRGEGDKAMRLRGAIGRALRPAFADPWKEEIETACYDPQQLGFEFEDLLRVGEDDAAWQLLPRMEAVSPDSAGPAWSRAKLAARMGRTEQAIMSCRRALDLGGEAAQVLPIMIRLLRENGRLDEAMAQARSERAEQSHSAGIVLERAQIYLAQHDIQRALASIDEALELDPYHVESHVLRVRLSLERRDWQTAADSMDWIDQLAPADYRVQMRVVLLEMDAGHFEQVIPRLLRARELEPSDPETAVLLADAYFRLGNAAARQGDMSGARRHFEAALSYNARMAPAQANRVMVLVELGDFAAAENALFELLKLQPDDSAVRLTYGDVLAQNGKSELAYEQWRRVERETRGREEMAELHEVARSRL